MTVCHTAIDCVNFRFAILTAKWSSEEVNFTKKKKKKTDDVSALLILQAGLYDVRILWGFKTMLVGKKILPYKMSFLMGMECEGGSDIAGLHLQSACRRKKFSFTICHP